MLARFAMPSATLLIAAVALALTGCASGGGSTAAEAPDWEDSPLYKYLEPVYGVMDEDQAIANAQATEELIAACMAEEGFDYTPVDQSQNFSFEDDSEERGTEEWVAANGWGMVQTQAEMEAMQAETTEFVDPNQPYVESLSPSEQEAYFATLYGAGPSEEEIADDGSYEYSWEEAGCQGAAQHEVEGETYWQDEEFAGLMESMNSLWEDLEKQPRIVELDAAWSECMADAGHADLRVRFDAQNLIMEEQNAYWSSPESTGPTEEELQALKDREIELALADFRCARQLDYDTVRFEAQVEMEEQFIADHRSELDALVAAYGKGE